MGRREKTFRMTKTKPKFPSFDKMFNLKSRRREKEKKKKNLKIHVGLCPNHNSIDPMKSS